MPRGVKTDVRTYQMYINGDWVDSKSNKTFPVSDPATEETIAQVPDSNADVLLKQSGSVGTGNTQIQLLANAIKIPAQFTVLCVNELLQSVDPPVHADW